MADDTRERILEGALALLREKGRPAFSMEAVADWTGVSRKTIYNHFSGKNELLTETAATGLERIIGAMRAIAEDPALPSVEKLDRIAERGFRESSAFWGARHEFGAFPGAADVQSGFLRVRALLADLIRKIADDAVGQGILRSDVDTERFAYILVAVVGGLNKFEDPDRLPCTRHELLREAIRICLSGALSPFGAETLRNSRLLSREEVGS